MPIIPTTIPILILPILANIFPVFISGPFNQRAAANFDSDVVIRSAAQWPVTFPGTISSDIEVVAGQSWC